jgi:hypothetical protein
VPEVTSDHSLPLPGEVRVRGGGRGQGPRYCRVLWGVPEMSSDHSLPLKEATRVRGEGRVGQGRVG